MSPGSPVKQTGAVPPFNSKFSGLRRFTLLRRPGCPRNSLLFWTRFGRDFRVVVQRALSSVSYSPCALGAAAPRWIAYPPLPCYDGNARSLSQTFVAIGSCRGQCHHC